MRSRVHIWFIALFFAALVLLVSPDGDENYILHLTVLVGYHDRHDTSSEVSDTYFRADLVRS